MLNRDRIIIADVFMWSIDRRQTIVAAFSCWSDLQLIDDLSDFAFLLADRKLKKTLRRDDRSFHLDFKRQAREKDAILIREQRDPDNMTDVVVPLQKTAPVVGDLLFFD